jgi:hypothetical protein
MRLEVRETKAQGRWSELNRSFEIESRFLWLTSRYVGEIQSIRFLKEDRSLISSFHLNKSLVEYVLDKIFFLDGVVSDSISF